MPSKLEVQNLQFSYEQKDVFEALSFDVRDGEFVGILGPSGCGKSTVLNLLTGIIAPASGEIRVDGAPISGMTSHFAYMPQSDLLLPWKSNMDNVCLYARIHGGMKEAREKAAALFPAFGLSGYENAFPDSLSGGMRQRVAFLRTAMCSADILLLDEPFGALDVITRGDMQDWLISKKTVLDRTALLVTHDIDEAIYLCDRILIMGGTPARIVHEVIVPEKNRTREWLFEQGALRSSVYTTIRSLT